MQDKARVVIVGGGIAGASIAYHLAALGWRDVVVLEQGPLVSGTTSHAPGLVGQLRSSVPLATMLRYSVSLYKRLRLDGVPGFQGEGSLRLASSKARLEQMRQQAALAATIGLECHWLTPREAGQHFPMLNLDGVEAGLYVPDDGSATATVLAGAMIDAAQHQGVAFRPHTRVIGIDTSGGAVRSVKTSAGPIATDILVAACGIWSPLLGRLAGVPLPLTPMQHQYVMTGPLPQLAGKVVPNLRDPDNLFYLRQRDQCLVIGGYERTPKPFDVDAIPKRPDPTVQTYDPAQFDSLMQGTIQRVPALKGVELVKRVNGLESFTPDGEFLLGPAPNVRGFWAACGFCAHGVSSAGGIGKVLAEWIVSGDPGLDLAHMAPGRFGDLDKPAIQRGACQVYETYYDIRT